MHLLYPHGISHDQIKNIYKQYIYFTTLYHLNSLPHLCNSDLPSLHACEFYSHFKTPLMHANYLHAHACKSEIKLKQQIGHRNKLSTHMLEASNNLFSRSRKNNLDSWTGTLHTKLNSWVLLKTIPDPSLFFSLWYQVKIGRINSHNTKRFSLINKRMEVTYIACRSLT